MQRTIFFLAALMVMASVVHSQERFERRGEGTFEGTVRGNDAAIFFIRKQIPLRLQGPARFAFSKDRMIRLELGPEGKTDVEVAIDLTERRAELKRVSFRSTNFWFTTGGRDLQREVGETRLALSYAPEERDLYNFYFTYRLRTDGSAMINVRLKHSPGVWLGKVALFWYDFDIELPGED